MQKKHKKTLSLIFHKPARSDVVWKEIEQLLIALGADLTEGRGSRVRIFLNGVKAVFHRPHPQKETDKGALSSMKRFLEAAGVKNDEI
jgi:hypothetical protein